MSVEFKKVGGVASIVGALILILYVFMLDMPDDIFAYDSNSDILSALGVPLIFSTCLITTAISLMMSSAHGKRKVLNIMAGTTTIAVAICIFMILAGQHISISSATDSIFNILFGHTEPKAQERRTIFVYGTIVLSISVFITGIAKSYIHTIIGISKIYTGIIIGALAILLSVISCLTNDTSTIVCTAVIAACLGVISFLPDSTHNDIHMENKPVVIRPVRPLVTEPATVLTVDKEPEDENVIIESDTPAKLVKRACFNMGLRYRIEHGDEKVHLVFAKSRVVVYIDDGEIDNSPDVQLQKDGWTVLHYVTDNITDGYAEAEEIKKAVKASLRAIGKSKKR